MLVAALRINPTKNVIYVQPQLENLWMKRDGSNMNIMPAHLLKIGFSPDRLLNLVILDGHTQCGLTKKAEPPPTRDVNRDGRTTCAIPRWLGRFVRLTEISQVDCHSSDQSLKRLCRNFSQCKIPTPERRHNRMPRQLSTGRHHHECRRKLRNRRSWQSNT